MANCFLLNKLKVYELKKQNLNKFVLACHRIGVHGLLQCSSGNLSWRLAEEDRVAITTKGAWLGELDESEIALCRISDGQCLNDRKPSVEAEMHLGIHRIRKEVNVVLHFQSPCATAIACSQPEKVDFFVIPEVPVYIGPIGIVDYKIPGTQDLATAATAVMKNHNLALLKSHGLIAVGRTFDEVIQNAAFFELACEIILKGQDVHALSRDALDELKKTYGYTL